MKIWLILTGLLVFFVSSQAQADERELFFGFESASGKVSESPNGNLIYKVRVVRTGTISAGASYTLNVKPSPNSTAILDEDYKLSTNPAKVIFTDASPMQQDVTLTILPDDILDRDKSLVLMIQVEGKAPGELITSTNRTYTLLIRDVAQQTDEEKEADKTKDELPVFVSIGSNLNAVGQRTNGPNLYFDLVAFEPRAIEGRIFGLNRTFGGYLRVLQQQGSTSLQGNMILTTADGTPVPVVRGIYILPEYTAIRNVGRDSVRVSGRQSRYSPDSSTVRNTGFAFGVTIVTSRSTNQKYTLGFGPYVEWNRRELTVRNRKEYIGLPDTSVISRRQFISAPTRPEQQRYTYHDFYYGVMLAMQYKVKSLEIRVVPSVGLVSLGGRRGSPVFTNLYALLIENKFGFNVGCDIRALPSESAVINFSIFVSKAFKLENIYQALRLN